jgi:hypothetical protein
MNYRAPFVCLDHCDKEGRENGLPLIDRLLRSYAAAAGRRFDHPRLDGRLLHQDALLVPKRSDCIACHFKWFMAIVGHVAGFESRLVHEVSVSLGPVFKKIDGVCQREYFPNQAFPFLQVDGTSKVCVHRYLTENVGIRLVWRLEPSAVCRFILSLFPFQYMPKKFFSEVKL